VFDAVIRARVSHRGQVSLPAGLRHRWGIEDGGEITVLDLGASALVLPGSPEVARQELRRVLAERYEAATLALGDPELAVQ
jgi:bifunctional DNA-binding transcriptional regulator/antitoxin component of YhaV-PrlF toxin-antitoxin module